MAFHLYRAEGEVEGKQVLGQDEQRRHGDDQCRLVKPCESVLDKHLTPSGRVQGVAPRDVSQIFRTI